MDIKKIEIGKEYYLMNHGKLEKFICVSKTDTTIRIEKIIYYGPCNKRSLFNSTLNSVECERYVINK